jgi:hypothetical protein
LTNQWFRSWHGAPTDPKWLGIARKAGVAPGIVSALVWALLDRASQATERGSIAGYDADGLGCFMGCEAEQVEAVIALMHEKGVLAENAFTGWEKHQPKREDNSADRVKEYRERKKTQSNAPVTQCNAEKPPETLDTDTDTDSGRVSAREELADLEVKLREAAGWQSEPAPMLAVTGEVQALIENGADLETDVLPVVKALAPKCGNRTSWRYFLGAIARQRDQRIAAATIVSPPSSITGFSHAATRQKPTRSDIFAAINARIDAAERGGLAEGDGNDGIPLEGAA